MFALSLVLMVNRCVSAATVNDAELLRMVSSSECVGVSVNLEGQVLWLGETRDQLVLQTASGVLRVKMDLRGQPMLKAGERIRLSGSGLAGENVLNEALADNDGRHSLAEKSGTVFLERGLHPVRAQCFNGRSDFVFRVDYSGPGVPRQRVPDSILFRSRKPGDRESELVPGLNFYCYQGVWEWLPHWENWLPVKSGAVTDFDVSVGSQSEEVGLQFDGFLKIERAGNYTFWTMSDDGSRLFLGDDPLRIKLLDAAPLPEPRTIQPGEKLESNDDCFWAVTEGTVTALHRDPEGFLELELTGKSGRINVEMENAPAPPLFSRVRITGLCRSVRLAKNGQIAGRLMVSLPDSIEEISPAPADDVPVIATLAEFRSLATSGQRTASRISITGIVVTATSPRGFFGFQDQTGGILVHSKPGAAIFEAGQRIELKGTAALEGNRLFLDDAALVNNDGLHLRREKSGAMYLRAGRHSLRVSWFNRSNPKLLELYYEGPDISRRRVPNSSFSHPKIGADGAMRWDPGLNFVCYHGDWQKMPTTSRIDPDEMGTTTGLELEMAGTVEKSALEFTGYFEVPRAGEYFFTLNSDDGSYLFLDEQPPQVEQVEKGAEPTPLPIVPRQIVGQDENHRWCAVEGTVNFAFEHNNSLTLELSSDYGPVNVEVADAEGASPLLLLGSRVKIQGFCQSGLMSSGQGIAANIYTPGMDQIELLSIVPAQWNRYQLRAIRDVLATISSPREEVVARIQGKARINALSRTLEVTDDSGTIEMKTAQPLPAEFSGEVEALGRLVRSETNVVLECGFFREIKNSPDHDEKNLPLLTTILQVKQLPREDAQRGFPVKIRGVITLIRGTGSGFIIQDDTSAIDVWWPPHSNTSLPRIGDFWEVKGNTFAEFSPNIRVKRAVRLGVGAMPEPLHPAWDQLLNGSLDTRYVELQGIVTATGTGQVTLFTRSGKIDVMLSPIPTEPLTRYKNALVRIRGCVVPVRNQVSQQVQVGQIRLSNVALSVDETAPLDPFVSVLKHPSELLLFDARAGSLQRVKIAGQILHERGNELFLIDNTNSVRVLLRDAVQSEVGDLVEVVGFPELGGSSPVLRESVLRRTGRAPLPDPQPLNDALVATNGWDGKRVSIQARLIGISGNRSQRIVELQKGNREFVARVADPNNVLANLIPGSRLELTGVYAEQGSVSGRASTAFELLLNSPTDLKVLERPPWWTLRRVLMFAGGMVAVILAGIFWIVLLHRRVEENAAKLAVEVRRREKIQQQNVLEKERSRIAKDMHDQLGTNVTQVGLLAELTKKNAGDLEKTSRHAELICQRAFELGRTLDEIVWAVNPKNDSLDKFCDYIAVQAQELFQLTDILCRVDLPPEMPNHPLSAEVRHSLFLATKEALNNVVRHARAREVWIRFKLAAEAFEISIVDDGQGFVFESKHSLRNGLQNMKKRMEEIGGRFAIASEPERGTEVTFTLALNVKRAVPAGVGLDGHEIESGV